MNPILFIPLVVCFIITSILLPKWIYKCHKVGYLWEDKNKYTKAKYVAASGGFIVIIAFITGLLSFIAIENVIGKQSIAMTMFCVVSVVLLAALVGFVDDVLDLSKRFRIFFILIASIPLIVISAGEHQMLLPIFGLVNLGIFYTLIIIPVVVVGVTTTYNFLAGFNGLEAGQGIIILSFLSFIAYKTGSAWLSLIGLCMVASLVVFYMYNKYPAKTFPGDILTYSIGALIVTMAILGNFEKIAAFIFIPYIIEMILKLRGKLKKQSFCIPQEDGSLELPYKKIYGLTHLSLYILKIFKKKVYEKNVVYLIFVFQIIICVLSLIIFRRFIF